MNNIGRAIAEHLTRLRMWREGMPSQYGIRPDPRPDLTQINNAYRGDEFLWDTPAGLGWCRVLLEELLGYAPDTLIAGGANHVRRAWADTRGERNLADAPTDAEAHARALLVVLEGRETPNG
mgnify:FL=1